MKHLLENVHIFSGLSDEELELVERSVFLSKKPLGTNCPTEHER